MPSLPRHPLSLPPHGHFPCPETQVQPSCHAILGIYVSDGAVALGLFPVCAKGFSVEQLSSQT